MTPLLHLVRPDDGGIDDQIFKVRIIGHRLEDPPPNTLDAPSTEAPKHAVPIAKRLRKITPRRARTHDPQHTFHNHPIVAPGRTFLVRSTPRWVELDAPGVFPLRAVRKAKKHHRGRDAG